MGVNSSGLKVTPVGLWGGRRCPIQRKRERLIQITALSPLSLSINNEGVVEAMKTILVIFFPNRWISLLSSHTTFYSWELRYGQNTSYKYNLQGFISQGVEGSQAVCSVAAKKGREWLPVESDNATHFPPLNALRSFVEAKTERIETLALLHSYSGVIDFKALVKRYGTSEEINISSERK